MENSSAQDPSYLRPGTQVGEWRVVSRRGRGRHGAVYRVERVGQEGGAPFALKMALHPMDVHFEWEAELLSRVRHDHVPRLLGSGVWRGAGGADYPYLVMQWVEGEPLYAWAERHKPSSRQVTRLLAQVARALEALHAVDGVHRDVKGDNVLVEPEGRAVLVDFSCGGYRGARRLAQPGELVGTPRYWSPEALTHQWRHRRRPGARYEATPADDVYALGVMAYRLVVGAYPPELELVEAVSAVVRTQRVEPEAIATVSPELAAIIRQMLSDDPLARGHAGQVAEALEQAMPRVARTSWWQRARLGVQRPGIARLGWMTAATLAGVAIGYWGAGREQKLEQPTELARAGQVDREDTEPTTLGQGALTERVGGESPNAGGNGIRVELPKKPVPGQRRPPCTRYEVELNGGCWVAPPNAVPPCDEGSYEWKKGCYWPVLTSGRPSTSEQR